MSASRFDTVYYDEYSLVEAASQVLFGNPHFMPVATAIQDLQTVDLLRSKPGCFMPITIGVGCDTADRAIARLKRLGMIVLESRTAKTRRLTAYRRVDTAPGWSIVRQFNDAMSATRPLSVLPDFLPPEISGNHGWYTCINLEVAQDIAGSIMRLGLLVDVYRQPLSPRYVSAKANGFDPDRRPNVLTLGLVEAFPGGEYARYQCVQRTMHPLLGVIPLLWQLAVNMSPAETFRDTFYTSPFKADPIPDRWRR